MSDDLFVWLQLLVNNVEYARKQGGKVYIKTLPEFDSYGVCRVLLDCNGKLTELYYDSKYSVWESANTED